MSHGINIPLSALRTKKSCGIGEFFDLLPLIDWCQEVGFNIIQLLPLNDSGTDPSPYNALSSCALNPIYLSLSDLPDAPNPGELGALQHTPYHDILTLKYNFLRDYYAKEGKTLLNTTECQTFIESNPWLIPYALFKTLKDRLSQTHWMFWPDDLKKPNYDLLLEKHHDDMLFYVFVQYLCFEQMTHVKRVATSKTILLKGDIPILVSPDSVDCWLHPELFDFTYFAGAPPDSYNLEGQNWGFPLFNWERVKSENFGWWKERLFVASHYYNLYRIDHVVGLFRIWAILPGGQAREGKFIPENPALWIPQGKEVLQMMSAASPMQPIAEDLGTIPPSVRTCLAELGIPGTKVVRWERDYTTQGKFLPYADYPSLSMTTVSTHDSETLQQWWQSTPQEAQLLAQTYGWTYSPDLTFDQRLQLLHDAHHTPSRYHINLLQEYLALFPAFVWPHPNDERINIPGTVTPTNWTYRFRPSVEEFTGHAELKKVLKKILSST
jgi:4-alpha-glucanotransferase